MHDAGHFSRMASSDIQRLRMVHALLGAHPLLRGHLPRETVSSRLPSQDSLPTDPPPAPAMLPYHRGDADLPRPLPANPGWFAPNREAAYLARYELPGPTTRLSDEAMRLALHDVTHHQSPPLNDLEVRPLATSDQPSVLGRPPAITRGSMPPPPVPRPHVRPPTPRPDGDDSLFSGSSPIDDLD